MGSITSSLRTRRRLTWLVALGAAAGIIAVLVVVLPNRSGGGGTSVAPVTPTPRQQIQAQAKKLKRLPPEARRVAGEFLLTALARKHLERAWPIAGPEMRAGMTYKQWLGGSIPAAVADGGVGLTHMGVDSVTTKEAVLEVLVDPTKAGKTYKPAVYWLRLDKIRGHWFVNELQPRVSVMIPHVS